MTSLTRRNVVFALGFVALLLSACGGGEAVAGSALDGGQVELLQPAEGDDVTNDGALPVPDPEDANAPSAGVLPPSEPTGLTVVSTGEGTINIEWDPSRDDGASSYEVLRSTAGGATMPIEVEGTSLSDTGLVDGEIFTYRVAAIRDGARSGLSDAVTAQAGVDTNPPRRPGRPEVIETASGQVLTWTPTEDVSGIGQYEEGSGSPILRLGKSAGQENETTP